jgi:hypothetical protein
LHDVLLSVGIAPTVVAAAVNSLRTPCELGESPAERVAPAGAVDRTLRLEQLAGR